MLLSLSSLSSRISGFLLQATGSAGCVSFQQPVPFQRIGPRVSGQIYFGLSGKYSYWLLHWAYSPGTQIWNGSLNVCFVLDLALSLQSMSADCKDKRTMLVVTRECKWMPSGTWAPSNRSPFFTHLPCSCCSICGSGDILTSTSLPKAKGQGWSFPIYLPKSYLILPSSIRGFHSMIFMWTPVFFKEFLLWVRLGDPDMGYRKAMNHQRMLPGVCAHLWERVLKSSIITFSNESMAPNTGQKITHYSCRWTKHLFPFQICPLGKSHPDSK